MKTVEIIDKFVRRVENSELIFEKRDLVTHINKLEDKLNNGFPSSFRSLISRYAFIPFEIETVYFYGNYRKDFPKEIDTPSFYSEFEPTKSEISNAIFQDKILYEVTSKNGFIIFARPSDESYDPICFDTRKKKSNHEYPIVRLDHEEILCNEKIRIVENISDSFHKFVSEFLNK